MNVEIQPGFQNLTVVYLPQVDESRLRVYYLGCRTARSCTEVISYSL